MAVYVDDMHTSPLGKFGRMKMSHMMADSLDELHAFAAKIGIKRRWFQGDHYDISKTRRALAVHLGAKEITMREMAAFRAFQRVKEAAATPGKGEQGQQCARTRCKNTGAHYQHRDLRQFYCQACARAINQECKNFGDAPVFQLEGDGTWPL